MVKYSCENCQKTFAQKGHLEDHKNRKWPCKKDNTIEILVEQKLKEALSNTIIGHTKIETIPIDNKMSMQMEQTTSDYSSKTREELITICKAKSVKGYSGKKKDQILSLLSQTNHASLVGNTNRSIRYLGCKQKLLEHIEKSVQKCREKINRDRCVLFDAFSGTGTVSSHFSKNDYDIIACDILSAASILTKCKVGISRHDVKFVELVSPEKLNRIEEVLSILNNLPGEEGYITKTYTPAACNRMYFTANNGKKIDAIREKIQSWFSEHKITQDENDFLLGCLLVAVSLISNTAGTYGAFNKKWDQRAEKSLTLTNCFVLGEKKHTVLNGDINSYIGSHECDILYIDPPYNERQYGNYYHLLETIVRNDKPIVKGVTGVRNCSDVKSEFCISKRVESALGELLKSSNAKYIIMSYNNEGLLSKEKILELMKKYGDVQCEEIAHERYNRVKDEGSKVVEYIFTLTTGVMETNQIIQTIDQPVQTPLEWHNTVYNVDCIEGMKQLPDKSVNLILTDLPYGLTECKWDSVIPLKEMWNAYRRIIKPDGVIVLFAQQPFSSMLVSSNLEMFKYSLVWRKTKTGNFAQAPYRFLCEHEDILVFSFGKVSKNGIPRMKYFPQGTKECNIKMKGKNGNTAHREGRSVQKDYVQTTTNYPRSILEFGNEGKPLHPTQKPVDICEYLIRSYTEEGDIVLDSCMGACTTAIAAIKSKRVYIGYEKEEKYYDIGIKRIKQITAQST